MTVVSRTRRPSGLAVFVLLAVVLAALSSSAHTAPPAARKPGVTVESSVAQALTPIRAIGRPAAEPTPSVVHSEPKPLGVLSGAVPSIVLARLDSGHADALPAPLAAHHPGVGGRAPPFRLSDL
jgi:hypothetical protein